MIELGAVFNQIISLAFSSVLLSCVIGEINTKTHSLDTPRVRVRFLYSLMLFSLHPLTV